MEVGIGSPASAPSAAAKGRGANPVLSRSSRRLRRCPVPPPPNRVITFPTPFPYIASARRRSPSSAVSATKIPSSSSLRRIRAIVLGELGDLAALLRHLLVPGRRDLLRLPPRRLTCLRKHFRWPWPARHRQTP